MADTFVEYTNKLLEKYEEDDYVNKVLVLCSEYHINEDYYPNIDILNVKNLKCDLNKYIQKFRTTINFNKFDAIILSRVFEHLPFRDCDYYLYNLSTIMHKDSVLILTVPDMKKVFNDYINELDKEKPDHHKLMRYNIEIFSEGDNVYDRHCLFTSEDSIKYHLKMENIFKIEKIKRVKIDTDWIDFLEFTLKRR